MRDISSQIYSPARISKRRKQIKEILSRSIPVAVFSIKDGIVMITKNKRPEPKIFTVHNRVAVGAIGNYEEIQEMRTTLISDSLVIEMMYSPKDVSAEVIAKGLSSLLKDNFYNVLYKPFEIELAIAQVNEKQEEDQIFYVSFDGRITESRIVIVGSEYQKKEENNNSDNGEKDDRSEILKIFDELKSQYSSNLSSLSSQDVLKIIMDMMDKNENEIAGQSMQSAVWEIKLLDRRKLGENEEFEDILTVLR